MVAALHQFAVRMKARAKSTVSNMHTNKRQTDHLKAMLSIDVKQRRGLSVQRKKKSMCVKIKEISGG